MIFKDVWTLNHTFTFTFGNTACITVTTLKSISDFMFVKSLSDLMKSDL